MFGSSKSSSSSLCMRKRVNNNFNAEDDLLLQKDNIMNDGSKSSTHHIENILDEYRNACEIYGCHQRINAGILTTFRFQLPSLRVSGSFFDSDMLALVEVLLKHINGDLSYIKRLDFSLASKEGLQLGKKGVRSHGAFALSKVLQISKHVEEVFLPGNKIGSYGGAAIFSAVSTNPTLRTLLMRGCRIGERGAFAFVSHVLEAPPIEIADGISEEEESSNNSRSRPCNCCGLREIDLSANRIGFYGVFSIEKALKRRMELDKNEPIEIDLEANMVFQEVMNTVTHGLGIALALIGTVLLSERVRGKSAVHVFSCALFSISLVVLYLSSTLFHSFFALQRTRYIFQVFDMCAIYILIAGSYTPFLMIIQPVHWLKLLTFIWVCSLAGILVEAILPLWKHKPKFSLTMYLGMGWTCLICLEDLANALPTNAICCVVAGGVAYTGGVPFFVRNSNLDHSIWHCFVLAGSIFHWLCVYLYVANL